MYQAIGLTGILLNETDVSRTHLERLWYRYPLSESIDMSRV